MAAALFIRPMTPADAARVLALNATARPNVAPLDDVELARLRDLSTHHIVAVNGEAMLGYALCFAQDDAYDGEEFAVLNARLARPFLYVDQVVVAAAARGSGVGRHLYGALEQAATRRGAHRLCCEVNTTPPNPQSLAFHSRLGFLDIGSFATRDGRVVALLEKHV